MGLSWFITNPVVGYIVKSSEAETQPLVYKVLKVTLHFKAGLQSFCKEHNHSRASHLVCLLDHAEIYLFILKGIFSPRMLGVTKILFVMLYILMRLNCWKVAGQVTESLTSTGCFISV